MGYFWKITNISKRCFWDVSEISRNRYFSGICSRRLKDVPQKTSFMRCFWAVLKKSQKNIFLERSSRRFKGVTKKLPHLRCFWEVSEMSLSLDIWLTFLREISCRLGNLTFMRCWIREMYVMPKDQTILGYNLIVSLFYYMS